MRTNREGTSLTGAETNEGELARIALEHLAHGSSGAFVVLEVDGAIAYVNPVAERLLGHARAEVLGRSFLEFVAASDRGAVQERWEACAPEEGAEPFSCQVIGVDDPCDWEMSAAPRDAGGKWVVLFTRSSNETTQAAQELRRSELRLQAVLAGMMDAVVTIDSFGTIQRASRSVEEVFGYAPEELLGQNVKLLMPEPHRSAHDGYLERYRETGQTWILDRTREFEVVRKDGTAITCDLSVSRIDVPGETEPLFCGSFRDVTERKRSALALAESERRLRAIFDQEFQLVGLMRPDGKVVECNQAAVAITGREREDIVAHFFWDVCWPEQDAFHARMRAGVERARAGEFVRFEAVLPRPDGTERVLDISLKPIRGASDAVELILGEGRDITALKRSQQRELSMLRSLASIGEQAAVLTHEIKNPITAVNAALRAVSEQLGEDHQLVLGELVEKMRRLEGLMRRTLSFVRPIELEREQCRLGPLVRATVQDLSEAFEEQGTELLVDVEEGLPKLRVDTELFGDVLINLLVNAREALEEGGRVEVRVRRDGGELCVHVQDDGPGVPAQLEEQLFEPFVTSKRQGTGIGLALARRLVVEHGGKLEHHRPAEGGACFTLRLPHEGDDAS